MTQTTRINRQISVTGPLHAWSYERGGPDRSPLLMWTPLTKRIRMQGFIIFDDHGHRYPEFAKDMGQWLQQGKVTVREDIIDGLENAPQAFMGLLDGKNFGKLMVQVSSA